jgi:hypothetical protein
MTTMAQQTVRLYRITVRKAYMMCEQGDGWSLTPWGRDTEYYEGSDDGGREYVLPAGYRVGDCCPVPGVEDLQIYDERDCHCTIMDSGSPGLPCLVSATRISRALLLVEAAAGE